MRLRDYQQQASDSIIKEWDEEGKASTLLVLPTGLGKTIVIADVINRHPGRTLMIAHREELIWQARDRIRDYAGLDCGIEMADLTAADNNPQQNLFGSNSKYPVIVATVQTLVSGTAGNSRMSRHNPREFSKLIIDECHHSTAQSYRNIVNYYTQHNPEIKILGVTATPDRADEEALGQIFQSVAMDYEISDAVKNGWLVDIEQIFIPVSGLDFSHIKTTAGDLNQGQLAAVMEAERHVQGVVQPTLETMYNLPQHELSKYDPGQWGEVIRSIGNKPRRTLIFTVSVRQSELMAEIFNRVIPGMANWVCGKTPKDQRREMLARYDANQFPVMVNCNCLTEGYDSPGVEIVVQAKPTKSRTAYAQQIGRATRPLAGVVDGPLTAADRKAAIAASPKKVCTVLDFVGNSGKHKLMSVADILGGKCSDDVVERAIKRAMKLGRPVNMTDALEDADNDIRMEIEARKKAEAARKQRLVAKSNYSSKFINPFNALDISPSQDRVRAWDQGRQLSMKQKELLAKQGCDPNMPYHQGKHVLNEIFRRFDGNLCSVKQANILKRYGYETKNLTRKNASEILNKLAANGWKRVEPAAA
jgi:superfamily II DNA or RNA helicase